MPRSSDTLALLQVRYNRHIALKTTTTTKNPHIIPSTSSVQNSISKISGHFTAFPKPVQMPFFFHYFGWTDCTSQSWEGMYPGLFVSL